MEDVFLLEDCELEAQYQISVRGAIISGIKHIRRYGIQKFPKDLWLKILFYAMKGMSCEIDHLDISQRASIYKYLKTKEIDNPYIQQFIEDTERDFKNAIL